MKFLLRDDPEMAELVKLEEARIDNTLNLIAAENHSPRSILEIMGSIFNTKTIEGYPGNRYHAGCKHVDTVENLAIERAKAVFGAEYANVQPHSGTSANLAVYFSVLDVGDRILSMSLPHGGHLSHGHRASATSRCFNFKHYALDPSTERIDYQMVRKMALRFKPKMIVTGASSYPRLIDYKKMSEIAKEISAYLLADIAHLAGLVAGEAIPSPVPHCDFVTFTCYKTLMGGRGGMILAKEEFAKKINKSVFPGTQGTSAVSLIAAKAVIMKLASDPKFIEIQKQTVENAAYMASCLAEKGYRVVTGGTDNHQIVVDLSDNGITGAQAEQCLEDCGIVLNRNVVPADAKQPGKTSGIRIGTGALSARGLSKEEMSTIVEWMDQLINNPENPEIQDAVKAGVNDMCTRFPVYANGHDIF
ncbi:serine hydroxymethyltransferase [Thermodesulfobacteriota bacterium]